MELINAPTYITAGATPLFGILTLPADKKVRGAVLICPALGKERNHTVRGLKRLSEELAGDRLAVLRFDYAGTGESAGLQSDPDAVAKWDESITRCLDYLNKLGVGPAAVVGHRSGALLAANNEQVRQSAPALALWDPAQNGRRFVRSQQMLYSAITEGPETTDNPNGEITHLAGLELHRDAARTLSKLRINPDDLNAWGRDVHLLIREDEIDEPFSAAIKQGAGAVTAIGDQRVFTEALDPWYTVFPPETSRIVRWMSERFSSSTAAVTLTITRRAVMHRTPEGIPVETRLNVADNGIVYWDTAISGTHESAKRVLMSHPIGHDTASGPTRVFTELALELAAGGVRTVRFDRRGVGESCTTTDADTFSPLFTKSYVRDGIAILDEIDLTNAEVIAHVGVCAGAWMAVHAAIESKRRFPESRSASVIVNPNRWDLQPASQFPRPRGRGNSLWTKVERKRQFAIAGFGFHLVQQSAGVRPRVARSALARIAAFQMPDVFLNRVRRKGVEVRLVLGPGDDKLFTSLDGPRTVRRRGISIPVHRTQQGDHPGYHAQIRAAVRDAVSAALDDAKSHVIDVENIDPVVEPDQPVHSPVR